MLTLAWIGVVLLSCAWVAFVIVRGGSDNEYANGAEIDEGALEGDLRSFVKEQNEVRQ